MFVGEHNIISMMFSAEIHVTKRYEVLNHYISVINDRNLTLHLVSIIFYTVHQWDGLKYGFPE